MERHGIARGPIVVPLTGVSVPFKSGMEFDPEPLVEPSDATHKEKEYSNKI